MFRGTHAPPPPIAVSGRGCCAGDAFAT
jgi:hypothetical protein